MNANDLNLLAAYLARRDVPELVEPVDFLVLVGSSILGSIGVVAEAFGRGIAPRIVICGGIGHSTQDLRDHVREHPRLGSIATEGRAESEIMRDILVKIHAVPESAIAIETVSTNCGANAVETRKIVDSLGGAESLAIIQDPTMQRRTHASFVRAWQGAKAPRFVSFAPFIPVVSVDPDFGFCVNGDTEPIWPFDRFLSLILGEIIRLRDDESGYGPNGQNFIDHVDIPIEVISADNRLHHAALARN